MASHKEKEGINGPPCEKEGILMQYHNFFVKNTRPTCTLLNIYSNITQKENCHFCHIIDRLERQKQNLNFAGVLCMIIGKASVIIEII